MNNRVLKALVFTAIVLIASTATVGKHQTALRSSISSAAKQAVANRETGWQDNGGGDIAFLNRHNIDCKTGQAGAISMFHMKRSGGISDYEYQCTDASSIDWTTCTTKTTALSDLGADRKESLNFLDRQTVQCDAGNVLTQFQLKTSNNDWRIQYQYTCCQAVLDSCTSMTTSAQDLGSGNSVYLDRQTVKVPTGAVMTGFHFQAQYPSGGGKTGNYQVSYCMPKLKVTHRNVDWQDNGGGDIAFLNRQNIDCKTGQAGALTSFHMRRNGGVSSYEYDCTLVRSLDWDKCTSKTTGWNDLGADRKESLAFLDRHNIKCSAGSVLTQFQLQTTNNDWRIQYQYTCCAADVGDCSSKDSSVQDIGSGNTVYLDRQTISAESNTVLSGFQYQRKDSGSTQRANYRVDSCAVKF